LIQLGMVDLPTPALGVSLIDPPFIRIVIRTPAFRRSAGIAARFEPLAYRL
jgi:hypothetical protein